MTSQKKSVVVFVLVALTVGALLFRSKALYGHQPQGKSLPRTLEVEEILAGEGATRITLKNISDKNINGLQLAIDGSSFTIEFLDADEPKRRLTPGGTYQEWFPVPASSEVTILAAVFDDNSSNGNQRLAQEILDTRRGVKSQLKQFKRLLEESLTSASVDESTIEKLSSELDKSVEDGPTDSGAIRLGRRKAQQQIRHDLEALKRKLRKDANTSVRDGLTFIGRQHALREAELP